MFARHILCSRIELKDVVVKIEEVVKRIPRSRETTG